MLKDWREKFYEKRSAVVMISIDVEDCGSVLHSPQKLRFNVL
jgi:hypothetical protein